jgi:predicted nucleic acid-binding protein
MAIRESRALVPQRFVEPPKLSLKALLASATLADRWGRMSAIRPIPVIDGLLAATAKTNGLTLVTRNDRDIADLGVAVFNPFRAGQGPLS